MIRSTVRSVAMSAVLVSGAAWLEPASAQVSLGEVVVTPGGRPEPRKRVTGTVQVIGRDLVAANSPAVAPAPAGRAGANVVGPVQIIENSEIERSTAKSVTELLAQNAVGFMSEWTPGQTSINIRGAATDGQGRDFKSQVLVLINGHRAGTANLSKMSLADIDRIEIVRGPSSVIYGSQNMGGVINIIMKTGRTSPGTFVEGSGGSWGLEQGKAQNGGVYKGFDWYVGAYGGKRDDFRISGGNRELNTAWTRHSGSSSLGYQIDENNRVDFNIRTDGVFDVGFRGSSANTFASDNRYNSSFDVSLTGGAPAERLSWFFQAYGVNDVDDLNNPSPLSAAINPRTSLDRNKRNLDIIGTRLQPRVNLFSSNELLLGWDAERSWLRSTRERAGLNNAIVPQLAPTDNNQNESVNAFYLEDVQTLLDDRLTLRGGVRRTYGTTTLDPTPFAPTLNSGKQAIQGDHLRDRCVVPGAELAHLPDRRLVGLPGADRDRARRQFHDRLHRQRHVRQPEPEPGNEQTDRSGRDSLMERHAARRRAVPEPDPRPHHEPGSQLDQRRHHLRHHQQFGRDHAARDRAAGAARHAQGIPHCRGQLALDHLQQRLLQFQHGRPRRGAGRRHDPRDARLRIRGHGGDALR